VHWRDFGFHVVRCLFHEDDSECRSMPDDERILSRLKQPFGDLRVSKAEIATKWPKPDEGHPLERPPIRISR
jgi:hypothetical protein